MLYRRLHEQLSFLSEDRRTTFLHAPVVVTEDPRVIAESTIEAGTGTITISTGFVNLIANSIYSATLTRYIPDELDSIYLPTYRQDLSAADLLINALYLLQLQAYKFGHARPNSVALLPEDAKIDCDRSIAGAILFTLLHELGHIELGHLTEGVSHPSRYAVLIPEDMTEYKREEMDADQYALDSLIDEAKILGLFWQRQALSFFSSMELMTGHASSDNHPVAINRGALGEALKGDWGEEFGIQANPGQLAESARRFFDSRQYSPGGTNPMIETTRAGCLRVLAAVNELSEPLGFSLRELWMSPAPDWLNLHDADSASSR